VVRLRVREITSVYRLSTEGGGVMMGSDAHAGFAWQGPAIDAWLGG
jgi:hypothetical protein